MENFLRALRKASKHWGALGMAAACSFAVAALWGANIGAFYPILEVTIRGKSMQQWLDQEIDDRQKAVDSLEARQAQNRQQRDNLTARIPGAPQASLGELSQQRTALELAASDLSSQAKAERSKLAGYQRIEPWVRKFVPSSPFHTIAWIVAALMLSTVVKHVFLIANETLVGRVAQDVSRELRMQIFRKAMYMDRGGYARYGTAGFTVQITHTTDMLSNGLMNALGAALREPMKMLACLIGAGLICWRLLLLSLVVAPVVGWLLFSVTRHIKRVSKSILGKAGTYHAVMQESLSNIHTVQAYDMQESELAKFGQATLGMRNFAITFIFLSSLTKPIIEFLGLGMLGTTIIGGAYLVLNKETALFGIPICNEPMSVSALLVFFGMLIGVSDPLRKLSAVYASIYQGTVAADAVFPILDREDAIRDPDEPREAPQPHRMLTLQGVRFSYLYNKPILANVSLQIPYGSTIAFVGDNGSGKSTLINLLCRFYDPQHGSLSLDGVDFRHMRVADLRKRIALVTQNTELFNASVAYNIRYGRPEATDDEVEDVAKQALAHEFICSSLDAGYETIVGQNGQKLSGGQRQRIAVARALLCNPEILILDEATSQIDAQSEQLIRESLARHLGQRTMIIITHREKLLELADRVFEVRNGQFIETVRAGKKVAFSAAS